MSTQSKTISASEFKARCLGLLDHVARTRQSLIVTKRGKPVAKVVPTEWQPRRKLLGSVQFHGNIVDPILDEWNQHSDGYRFAQAMLKLYPNKAQ